MQKSTMTLPPPPPPPASPPTSAPKISRKTMIALGVIVIIVVAIVVGVILATRGGGTGGTVSGASSLQFSADITSSGTLMTYTYSAKNIGTSNGMLRIEWTGSQGNTIYIINGAQQKIWVYANGAWTDLSSYFTTYWGTWNSTFTGLRDSLVSHWSGSGDYTYTDPSSGDTIRIYNISVNPSLPDSLFQHS